MASCVVQPLDDALEDLAPADPTRDIFAPRQKCSPMPGFSGRSACADVRSAASPGRPPSSRFTDGTTSCDLAVGGDLGAADLSRARGLAAERVHWRVEGWDLLDRARHRGRSCFRRRALSGRGARSGRVCRWSTRVRGLVAGDQQQLETTTTGSPRLSFSPSRLHSAARSRGCGCPSGRRAPAPAACARRGYLAEGVGGIGVLRRRPARRAAARDPREADQLVADEVDLLAILARHAHHRR